MRIGLIGAGNIGSTLARLAVEHGHDVMISNSRGPETLAAWCRIWASGPRPEPRPRRPGSATWSW